MSSSRHAILATTLILLFARPAWGATLGVYDWSTATPNAVLDDVAVAGDNNDNWTNIAVVADGSGDFVLDSTQPTGFTGNYFSAVMGDAYARDNDIAFGYSIPSDVASIELSYFLTANASTFTLFGLNQTVLGALRFGNTDFGVWGVRQPDNTLFEAPGTGAAQLDGTRRSYRATMTIDWAPVGSTKLVDLVVENLTDGGSETIFSGLGFDVGALADPSSFNGLFLNASGSEVDALTISAVVPEPSTVVLFGSGLVALAANKRRRIR